MLSGSTQGLGSWSHMKWNCPCAIQAWGIRGRLREVQGLPVRPGVPGGAQVNAEITPSLTATARVMRPKNYEDGNGTPSLDWAYASWKATDSFSLQAGRKRIPPTYYSDYLYIGYAYPWCGPRLTSMAGPSSPTTGSPTVHA